MTARDDLRQLDREEQLLFMRLVEQGKTAEEVNREVLEAFREKYLAIVLPALTSTQS